MLEQQSSPAGPWAEKRRSQRLALSVPVVAYRPPKHGQSFYEGTRTLVVSAHGALLSLTAKVRLNQKLTVKNELTGQERECRIVFVDKKPSGPVEVAVEFQAPAPDFWRIAFPPVDWASAQ